MSVLIRNARVVLPDTVFEGGSVLVRNGVIESVSDDASGTAEAVLDADGAYLLPGLIDLHNDHLEAEVNPRPGANLPLPFALANLERRLTAAGVTTEFHAIAFMDRPKDKRSVATAIERSAYVNSLAGFERPVAHHVLHRIDVWHPHSLDAVFESLGSAPVPYASLNDHTPGQGQYRDISRMVEYSRSVDPRDGIEREIRERMSARLADHETVPHVYARVGEARQRRPFVLSTHDDDSVEKVDAQVGLGATVAEFPVTLEAAERARELGMSIVVGAPNVIRGGSSSGNLAATELVQRGLADVMCADYHAPSLLPAVFRLVEADLLDLPSAVRMVTLNAARAVGLTDRGAIQPGLRADLIVVRPAADGLPHVEATLSEGRPTYLFGRLVSPPPPVAVA
jgi:alpha-D-ribose 1-methylphosphonate 5-triphosphate diphosphatase